MQLFRGEASEVTSHERVMAAIDFRTPDRLPRWDNLHGVGDFLGRWRAAKGMPDGALPEDYYKLDVAMVSSDEGPFASRQGVVGKDGAYELFRDGWGRVFRQKPGEAFFMETVETVLDDKANLDRLKFEDPAADSRYEGFIEETRRERAAGRLAFTKVGGIYCRTHFMRREDELLTDMVTDEGFCHELFNRVGDHLLNVGLEELRRADSWGTGIWVYDDFANSRAPMFSPAMWEKYLLPVYSRMLETWRAAGCKHCFMHSDGNIVPNMDNLLAAGFEGFNPLEPRAGIDLLELHKRYGRKIVFFGGICNTKILPSGDKRKIEAHVRPLIELGREGGLVIGTHTIGDDISIETYDSYISLLDKYANYGGS